MASLELQLKMVEMVRDGLLSKTTIIKNNNTVGNQARCSCEGTILLDLYTSRTMFGLGFFWRRSLTEAQVVGGPSEYSAESRGTTLDFIAPALLNKPPASTKIEPLPLARFPPPIPVTICHEIKVSA